MQVFTIVLFLIPKTANRSVFGLDDKRYFISGALGLGSSLLVANKDLVKNAGVEAKGSIGKWYTPLSAWRANGTIMYKAKTSSKMNLHYAGLGMDYMISLATLAKRIQPQSCDRCCSFCGSYGWTGTPLW